MTDFTAGANRVEKALGRMTDTFSGRRVLQEATLMEKAVEAIGGTSKLTASELQRVGATANEAIAKLRALGQEAPAGLRRLADEAAKAGSASGGLTDKLQGLLGVVGVGAITGAGIVAALGAGAKAALSYADSLTRLSDKTGIGVVALQRLSAVAAASGNDIEQVSSSVNAFQKRLIEDSGTTSAALGRIGLSVAQLRDLSPDEQFFAIARGVAAIKDPAEQTRTAMDLFGKSGAEILPTLKADVDKLKDSTFKMSEESVKALDDFGDTLGAFGTSAVNVLGEVAGAAVRAATSIVDMAGSLPKQGGAAPGALLPNSSLMTLDDAKNKVKGFTDEVTFMGKTVKASTVGIVQGFQQGADAVDALHEAFKSYADQQTAKKLAEEKAAAERLASAVARISAAFEGYRHIVDGMDQSVVTEIRNAIEHGAAMNDLALKFKLTEVQAAALADQFRFESLVAKAAAGIHAELATEIYNVDKSLEKLQGRARTRIPALESGPNAQLAALQVDNLGKKIDGAAQAFAILAQVSGDTFGGMSQQIGQIVSQMNALQQSAQAFGVNLTNINAGIITLGLNVIGYLAQVQAAEDAMDDAVASVHFNALLQYAEDASRLLGTDVANAYLDAIGHAKDLAEAQRRVNELVAAMAAQQSLINDATAAVGPSQTQLDDAATRAREILDYVMTAGRQMKDGTFLPDFNEDQRLQAYYNWQKAMADAGNAAAKAWVEAHDAAAAGSATATAAMDALKAKRDGLAQSIANEAPEDVMGVIEAQIRGQIDALDAQMKAQQDAVNDNTDQATEAASTIEDEFRNCWVRVGNDAEAAADVVRDTFADLDLVVKVRYDYENGAVPQPQPIPMAAGGSFRVTKPTLFLVGEAGPEDAVFSGANKTLGDVGGGVSVGSIVVNMPPMDGTDPQALARTFKEMLRTDSTVYEAVAVVARRAS